MTRTDGALRRARPTTNVPRVGGVAKVASVARLAGRSAWRGAVGLYASDDLTYAASIAYYAILSLFPFLLLVFAVVGRATADPARRNAVLSFVLQYFPTRFDFITAQLDAFRDNTLSVGLAGTLALVWASLGVFGAITTAVNYAWGAVTPRGFWRHKLLSFLMLGVAALMLLAAVLLAGASQVVGARWFAEVLVRFPALRVLGGIAVRYAATALFIVVVGLIYYFVPNVAVRFRDVWAGAVVTGLLWKAAFEGFAWFVSDTSGLARVNGSVATAIVFLVWVYVQAAILLYGAEFTAAYARLRLKGGGEGGATGRGPG